MSSRVENIVKVVQDITCTIDTLYGTRKWVYFHGKGDEVVGVGTFSNPLTECFNVLDMYNIDVDAKPEDLTNLPPQLVSIVTDILSRYKTLLSKLGVKSINHETPVPIDENYEIIIWEEHGLFLNIYRKDDGDQKLDEEVKNAVIQACPPLSNM